MSQPNEVRFTVRLNGTCENPYHQWGCRQNPFPQIARHEYSRHILHLQALGGDPIPDVDYIRKYLAGWSQEFIDLCCQRFRPGEMVEFEVYFDGPSEA